MFYSVELYGWKTEKFKNSYTQLKKRLKRTANPERDRGREAGFRKVAHEQSSVRVADLTAAQERKRYAVREDVARFAPSKCQQRAFLGQVASGDPQTPMYTGS